MALISYAELQPRENEIVYFRGGDSEIQWLPTRAADVHARAITPTPSSKIKILTTKPKSKAVTTSGAKSKPPKIPSLGDFIAFFRKTNSGASIRTCFWSGVSEPMAKAFALNNGRFTLEMMVGHHYDRFTQYGPRNPHFKTFASTMPFWRAASTAFARFAEGEAYVITSWSARFDKKKVWASIERPILKQRGILIREYDEFAVKKTGKSIAKARREIGLSRGMMSPYDNGREFFAFEGPLVKGIDTFPASF